MTVDRFERRLDFLPSGWKSPFVEVMDTFETVSMFFESDDKDKLYSPELALGLTKIILDRHDVEQKKLDEEAQRNLDCN